MKAKLSDALFGAHKRTNPGLQERHSEKWRTNEDRPSTSNSAIYSNRFSVATKLGFSHNSKHNLKLLMDTKNTIRSLTGQMPLSKQHEQFPLQFHRHSSSGYLYYLSEIFAAYRMFHGPPTLGVVRDVPSPIEHFSQNILGYLQNLPFYSLHDDQFRQISLKLPKTHFKRTLIFDLDETLVHSTLEKPGWKDWYSFEIGEGSGNTVT